MRLIRDGEKEKKGVWRGRVGGGRGRLYTYRYTVTTRMTSALRWAAMRAILMYHNCEGQSHKTVSTDHSFWRERRAEADSNRGPSAYQPNALPLGQTGSLHTISSPLTYIYPRTGPVCGRRCQRIRSRSKSHMAIAGDWLCDLVGSVIRLQALVSGILLPTIPMIDHATAIEKLSANGQLTDSFS